MDIEDTRAGTPDAKIVEIGGAKVDLGRALPLTLGDWVELEKRGVTARALVDGKMTDVVAVIYYVLHKSDPCITVEAVQALPLNGAAVTRVLAALNDAERNVDRPT